MIDILQLKDKILHYAMHGLLSYKNAADTTFYDFIQDEKYNIKSKFDYKNIKKIDNEYFYQNGNSCLNISQNISDRNFPNHWQLVRLDFLASFGMGQTILTKDMSNKGIPVYSATMDDKPLGYIESSKNCVNLHSGDIVIPARGNSIGYVTYVNDENVSCTQTTIWMKLNCKAISKFVYYYLKAYKNIIFTYVGCAIPQVTVGMLSQKYIALPPIEEQERIVSKIEELFAIVDRLAQDQIDLENYKQLAKNKILDLALCGKLVKNNPILEPYKNINISINELKIKFVSDLPKNWKWLKISDISNSYIGLTYKPENVSNNGIIVLRSSNIQNGKLDLNDIVRVDCEINNKLMVDNGDIVICARNGSKKLVGKSAIINNMTEPMTFGAFMAICKSEISNYIFLFLQSSLFFNQLNDVSGTTTINQLTQKAFNDFIIPVPPIEEQKVIIEKVQQLFDLLDLLN